MRVLVDATSVPANRGGVGRYVDALLPALEQQGIELLVLCKERDATQVSELVPTADVVVAPAATRNRVVRLASEQLVLPRVIGRLRPDVLHCPHYTMPETSVPVVVTVHDATFFSHPQYHSRVKAPFFRAATRRAVKKAASIIVPSAATRDEVIAYAGGEPERFHIAYHGVDTGVFHPVNESERMRVAEKLGLDGPYVAFLGTLAPLKNVPALIRGWIQVAETLDAPPALCIAGGRGWDAGVAEALDEVPARLRVLTTGYLPLEDLPGYLSGASVVAFPSIAEGFGLPVLEAMACGAAVLTTRNSSLPEVGGDAVDYAEVEPSSIAARLRVLLGDPGLRHRLSSAALTRSQSFTWDSAATAHIRAYEQALTIGRPR